MKDAWARLCLPDVSPGAIGIISGRSFRCDFMGAMHGLPAAIRTRGVKCFASEVDGRVEARAMYASVLSH